MLVSIIVPFYKGNKYVSQICSSIEKNVKNLASKNCNCKIECIFINDSPSIDVILAEQNYTFPIKVYNHKKNSGIQQARVTGLKYAQGEYIIFLDQDDELLEDTVYYDINNIGNADILVCNAFMEDEQGELKKLYRTKGMIKNVKQLDAYIYGHNRIASPGQCLIKKASIPKEWTEYILEKNGSDDLFLWILMLEKKLIFKTSDKVTYIHKFTGTNLSSDITKMNMSSLNMINYLKKIQYIDNQTIKKIKKDKVFTDKIYKEKNKKRIIILMLKNIDVILNQIKWKLNSWVIW